MELLYIPGEQHGATSTEEHWAPCSGWHYSYSSDFCILYST